MLRCLTLNFSEEFNDRILCPELSDTEKMRLHEEVKKIYETYCLDESVDKIRFDPFIVEEIRNSTSIAEEEHAMTCSCLFAVNMHAFFVVVEIPSCRRPVCRGGEAADHEVFVRGLRARPVPPGERFHAHVLSQRRG